MYTTDQACIDWKPKNVIQYEHTITVKCVAIIIFSKLLLNLCTLKIRHINFSIMSKARKLSKLLVIFTTLKLIYFDKILNNLTQCSPWMKP